MYALARDIDAKDNETFYRKLQIDGELLGAARPTAVNLRWAVEEMLDTAKAHLKDDRAELLEALYRLSLIHIWWSCWWRIIRIWYKTSCMNSAPRTCTDASA